MNMYLIIGNIYYYSQHLMEFGLNNFEDGFMLVIQNEPKAMPQQEKCLERWNFKNT